MIFPIFFLEVAIQAFIFDSIYLI